MTEQQPDYGNQQPLSKKDAKAQAAASKAYAKSQRSWFAKHKILTALGVLIIFGVILTVANGGGGGSDGSTTASDSTSTSTSDTNSNGGASQAPASAEPAIVVTSKEMIATLDANALKAKSTYKGKRVTVSGYVGNIDASGAYFSLDPAADSMILTGIQVQTDKKFLDQVSNFSKGQAVTVTGKISDVGEILGYTLEAETIK